MIFYINMDGNVIREAIVVAESQKIAPPSLITYSIIVSRETVEI